MSLIYLATPYTNFPDGLHAACSAAARVTANLMKRGFFVYSPICHSHTVAETGLLDAVDHELWMRIDRVMMDRCDMLAVAKLPTWEASKGVAYEIEYFRARGKPVCYLEVPIPGMDQPNLGIRDAREFTQPPNCSPGVSEPTLPMHAVALEMAEGIGGGAIHEERTYRIGGHPPRTVAEIVGRHSNEPQPEYQTLVRN